MRPARRWPVVAALAGAAACAPAAPPPAAPPAVGLSYTAEQAERGREVFDASCAGCHAAREFTGRMFRLSWKTRPVGDFFQHIRTAMPQDRPGSLAPEEYGAVVAYVLRLNGHPAGDRELPLDPAELSTLRWP